MFNDNYNSKLTMIFVISFAISVPVLVFFFAATTIISIGFNFEFKEMFILGGIFSILFLPNGFIINILGKIFFTDEKKGTIKNVFLRVVRFADFTIGGISLVCFLISLFADIIIPFAFK